MEEQRIRCRKVDSPRVARELLKRGHRIHDIKPLRGDETRTRTSFLFEYTEALQKDLDSLVKERRLNHAELAERNVEVGVIF